MADGSGPGPAIAARPLHLFFLLDVSGSMGTAGKIQALNQAMREALQGLSSVVADMVGLELLIRVVVFAHDASWHLEKPTPVADVVWSDIESVEKGATEIGKAIALVTEAVVDVAAVGRGLPPALVLVSDGRPTDRQRPSFGEALRLLVDHPWGLKASRVAIAIGHDADLGVLRRFIGHDEIEPLVASNADELSRQLRWASTIAFSQSSTHGRDSRRGLSSPPPADEDVQLPPPTGLPVDLPPPDITYESGREDGTPPGHEAGVIW